MTTPAPLWDVDGWLVLKRDTDGVPTEYEMASGVRVFVRRERQRDDTTPYWVLEFRTASVSEGHTIDDCTPFDAVKQSEALVRAAIGDALLNWRDSSAAKFEAYADAAGIDLSWTQADQKSALANLFKPPRTPTR